MAKCDYGGTGFYSNLFTVPKPSGDVRPILDLKVQNRYFSVRPFRMESVRSVVTSLQVGDFQTSIDIRDAYLHVPLVQPHQKLMRFVIEERHFQFVALPFGLATTEPPRVFTKVLGPVLGLLRSRGILICRIPRRSPTQGSVVADFDIKCGLYGIIPGAPRLDHKCRSRF